LRACSNQDVKIGRGPPRGEQGTAAFHAFIVRVHFPLAAWSVGGTPACAVRGVGRCGPVRKPRPRAEECEAFGDAYRLPGARIKGRAGICGTPNGGRCSPVSRPWVGTCGSWPVSGKAELNNLTDIHSCSATEQALRGALRALTRPTTGDKTMFGRARRACALGSNSSISVANVPESVLKRHENGSRRSLREPFYLVAGTGFEPATSGL
jgi:hypothetical protein